MTQPACLALELPSNRDSFQNGLGGLLRIQSVRFEYQLRQFRLATDSQRMLARDAS